MAGDTQKPTKGASIIKCLPGIVQMFWKQFWNPLSVLCGNRHVYLEWVNCVYICFGWTKKCTNNSIKLNKKKFIQIFFRRNFCFWNFSWKMFNGCIFIKPFDVNLLYVWEFSCVLKYFCHEKNIFFIQYRKFAGFRPRSARKKNKK